MNHSIWPCGVVVLSYIVYTLLDILLVDGKHLKQILIALPWYLPKRLMQSEIDTFVHVCTLLYLYRYLIAAASQLQEPLHVRVLEYSAHRAIDCCPNNNYAV